MSDDTQFHQSKDTEPPAKPTDDAIEAIIHHATSSRPSPDPRSLPAKDTRTQLFVGNLPYRVRWQDLKDLFRKAGTVLRADVSLGPDNRSRGYGTVLLATAEDAGRAVDMFNGYSWQTRILEVRLDRLMPEYDPAYLATMASAGMSINSTAGSANSILSAMDLANSHLSHMGIHSPAVSNASAQLHPDDSVSSSYLADSSSSRSLFVGNLPFHCQWQDLKDLFRQAGTILRADVALGADGRSRGFGTVSFATEHDADRAMRMFNGYEYGGRQLKVHHDKFLQSSLLNHPGLAMPSSLPNSTSTIPSMKPLSAMTSQNQMSVALPPGYRYDFIPPSGPSSPYEMQSMRMHSAQHHPNFSSQPRSTQQSQLPSPLGQHLHQGPSPKQPHFQVPSPLRDHSHSLLQPQPLPHHQHFSRIFGAGSSSAPTSSPATSKPSNSSRKDVDMDNLAQALGATRFLSSPAKSSTSRNILSQSYAESRFDSARQSSAISSSTSASGISPAISNAPSSSTASSSTSISSTPSTAPKSAPESAPSSAVSSGSGPTRASERHQTQERKLAQQNLRTHHMASTYQHQQYSQQQQHPSQQPQSYQQHAASRQHHHPGPISLPPVPHVSFPGSPHTPLGHGMSLSPLYHPSMGSPYHLYPTAYHHAYQQQHYQHTPLGLPITPSMPPFTFLAPNSGTSGPNNNAGDRAPSANDAKARDDGSKSRRSSASVSTEESAHSRQSRNVQAQPGASADAQRANTTVDSHSGAGDMIPNQIAGGGGVPIHTNPAHMHAAHHAHARAHAAAAAAHAHAHAQHMPQPSPMHMRLNLANVPGAFSPGVAMSPGTFFGRPGEMAAVANPFINPAVGAPVHHVPMATVGMNMNMMGVPLMAMGNVNMNMNMNVNMSVNAGGGEGGEGQGQRHDMAAPDGQGSGSAVMMGMNVPMGVPHGAYFYAMSSPKRAGTGAEPQGYFDPNYFPMALQQQQQHHGDAGVDTSDASNQPPSQFQEGGNTQTEGEAGASTNRAEDSNTHEPPTQDSESVNPWYAQYRENDAAGIVVSSSMGSTISRTHSVGASRARGTSSSLDNALGSGAMGVSSSANKSGDTRSSLSPELPKMQTPLMKRSGSESAHTTAAGKPRLPIHARRGISKDGGSSTTPMGGSVAFQLSQLQLQAAAMQQLSSSQDSSALTSSTPPPIIPSSQSHR